MTSRVFLAGMRQRWQAKDKRLLIRRIGYCAGLMLKVAAVELILQHAVLSVEGSRGASMLPTLNDEGDWLLRVHLRFYRFIAPYLPADVAPAFHQGGAGKAPTNVGGPKGKLDPSMGLGLSVGDLVVIGSRNNAEVEACKRIIAMAGDTVLVDPRFEPTMGHPTLWKEGQQHRSVANNSGKVSALHGGEPRYIVVPPGHVWVGGDNLANSTDSRDYGPVPLGLVRGRVIAKVGNKCLESGR